VSDNLFGERWQVMRSLSRARHQQSGMIVHGDESQLFDCCGIAQVDYNRNGPVQQFLTGMPCEVYMRKSLIGLILIK
jgi:hypothetical protein